MKVRLSDHILIIPGLLFLVSTILTMNLLVDKVQSMNNKIIAFSDCAQNMMDAAFLGQVYNFTECYAEKMNNNYINCYYNSTNIICHVNNSIYVYPLS
ncbi:MAG: hypothetical protein ACP5G1_01790 [Nanopusillaceae archaeon]